MSEPLQRSAPGTTPGTDPNDVELLLRLKSRNPEAMGAVYDRWGRIVFSFASRMLSDKREIEEVTQDVFLAVWKRAAHYQSEKSSPLAWLATITRNKCIDRLRKAGRRIPAMAGEVDPGFDPADDRRESDPLRMTLLRDLSSQVSDCLSRLSDSQRSTIELAYFDCLTTSEIAERISIPSGTVKSRMRLAMDKLRRCLRTGGES